MKITRVGFGALSPLVPAAAAVATVGFFLAGQPHDHTAQLAIGLVVGLLVWVVASVAAGDDLTAVTSASAETYEELRGRVYDLRARLSQLGKEAARVPELGRSEAAAEASALVELLMKDLRLNGDDAADGSQYRWLLGHGYVNAWRHVHRAEDILLATEPREVVYSTAVTNLDRLRDSEFSQKATVLDQQLSKLVGVNGDTRAGQKVEAGASALDLARQRAVQRASDDAEHEVVLREFDHDWARALVRESGYRIHKVKNDAWDTIVNLRNRLAATLVLAILLSYALVALAVLSPTTKTAMTAAVSFFLVGALVGVFNELYLTSRRKKGTVFDYGLAQFRLMTTPVLSGIAALGGVLITNLAGSFLVVPSDTTTAGRAAVDTTATVSPTIPTLTEIFDLNSYTMGLVVAAIFGLTPGLLLKKLRKQTDAYKAEIEKLDPGAKETEADVAIAI